MFQEEFKSKRIRFCTSLQAATVEATNGSIRFAESILGDDQCGPTLFKRDCYTDLFRLVEESRNSKEYVGAVITGTPGIGKTMFGVQCIYAYAVEKHITVLYKFRSEGYFIFSSKKVWQVNREICFELQGKPGGPLYSGLVDERHEHTKHFVEFLKNQKEVVYIVDLDKQDFQESVFNAFTIILSSTNRDKYSSALKSATLPMKVLWMETWSYDEVQKHLGDKIDNLDERFARHGGVPRYLLWSDETVKDDLDSVLDATTSEEFQVALDAHCKFEKFNGRVDSCTIARSRNVVQLQLRPLPPRKS